jgi:hypothetical protein
VAALERQLTKGDEALVDSTGYRRCGSAQRNLPFHLLG